MVSLFRRLGTTSMFLMELVFLGGLPRSLLQRTVARAAVLLHFGIPFSSEL